MERNKKIVSFGSVVFTRAEILFFNNVRKKGIVCIYGTCSGKDMEPIRVSAMLDENNRFCASCGKEIFWFIREADIVITNYLPASNEIVVRVKIKCECKTVREITLLLSLDGNKK